MLVILCKNLYSYSLITCIGCRAFTGDQCVLQHLSWTSFISVVLRYYSIFGKLMVIIFQIESVGTSAYLQLHDISTALICFK